MNVMVEQKNLPIKDKAEVTLYTHHALPLLIPFINSGTEGWYMNNFINIGFPEVRRDASPSLAKIQAL